MERTGNVKIGRTIAKSILGGIAIGMGCCAYVSVESKVLGAFLFSLGLLTICHYQWNLFTGKICSSNSARELILTWIFNIVGIIMIALLFKYATPGNKAVIAKIANTKLEKTPNIIATSAILCEFCIFIAVKEFKTSTSDFGKNILVILCIMTFILCGFEHCIADMFYLCFVPATVDSILFIILVTGWNMVGAFFLRIVDWI